MQRAAPEIRAARKVPFKLLIGGIGCMWWDSILIFFGKIIITISGQAELGENELSYTYTYSNSGSKTPVCRLSGDA